jgi:hypothetical protein
VPTWYLPDPIVLAIFVSFLLSKRRKGGKTQKRLVGEKDDAKNPHTI